MVDSYDSVVKVLNALEEDQNLVSRILRAAHKKLTQIPGESNILPCDTKHTYGI